MFLRCLLGIGVIVAGVAAPGHVAGGSVPPAAPVRADTLTLTLDNARRLALANNPAMAAVVQRWRAEVGTLRQARTFPFNPGFELESPGSFTTGNLGEYEVRIEQAIPLNGEWRLAGDVAEARAASVRWSSLDEARSLLRDVEGAFFGAAAAERRLAVAEDINILNDSLRSALLTLLAEGEVSALDASLASIEAARGRARALAARREASQARLLLARLLGLPLDQDLDLDFSEAGAELDPALTVPSALRTAYQTRPDMRAADQRVAEGEASARLAGRQAVPNPVVAAIADRIEEGQPSRFGIAVAIPLPLFDRRQGDRERAAAEARAFHLEREALRQRLEQEVREAFTIVRIAREEVEILTNEVLIPARENHGLLETAYREGKMDLSTLLLLRNQLLDAQMSYWDAWQRWREAEAGIRFATGASVYYYELPEELVR